MNPGNIASFFGRETTAPLQRMTANMILQIQDFTGSLFDAEARHYLNHTSDSKVLLVWLNGLVEDVRAQARKLVVDSRHDFHCSKDERFAEIEKELDKHVRYWLTQETRPRPKLPYPPHNPVGSRNVITPSPRAALDPPRAGIPAAPEMLGSQIRRLRVEARWTIQKLAEAIDVEPRTVERHESGKIKSLRPGTQAAYEKALTAALGRKIDLRSSG